MNIFQKTLILALVLFLLGFTIMAYFALSERPGPLGELKRFEGHIGPVYCVAFSPDGERALSAGGHTKLWDLKTGKLLNDFKDHKMGVNAAAFSPDGKYAVTGGTDKVVRLWDAKTWNEVRRFEGHKGLIYSVAFSHDGRQVASAGG